MMRFIIAIVLLVIVGIGIAGFSFGWFKFSTSTHEQKSDMTLSVDPEKIKKDRDTVTGFFHTSHAEFQKQAETRLQGMDKNLDELKAKAKTASAESKDELNQAISDLGKKTEVARAELKELGSATELGYDAVKTRFSASLAELKEGFEKASSRFQ
jgi:hypothetical protein